MEDRWEESFPQCGRRSTDVVREARPKEDGKGFLLQVRFLGICCFLPASDGLSMGVFLMNPESQEGREIPAHFGAIRFPLSQVKGVSGVPRNINSVYLPNHEEVRFTFEGEENVRRLEIAGFRDGVIAEEPLVTPTESLWWLLSPGDALRRRGMSDVKIDDRFKMDDLEAEDADELSARLLLTEGCLKVDQWIRYDEQRYVVWRLKPEIEANSDQDHLQFAASSVLLERWIPAASIRIMARSLEGGEERQVVELVPDKDRKLELTVLNEESNEILEKGVPGTIEVGAVRGQDRIFKSVRRLLANPPEDFDFPVPVAARFLPPRQMRGRNDDGGVRSAYPCSPSRVGG